MSDAAGGASTPLLISPLELAEALERGDRVRVLDVRWRLDDPNGRPAYLRGHIPTAVYVDLDHQLAAHGRPATEGRHPLPAIEDLQRAARSWGIVEGDTVVVYDDLKNLSSARAWWLLRHAGLPNVRVLDGSLRAWTDAGLPLETGAALAPTPGDVVLEYGQHTVLNADSAAAWALEGALLDVRAPERYTGEVEPIDPRAGHIPGARNLPTTGNVDVTGRFLAPEILRARFAEVVDVDRAVGVSCGSGVTASHAALALAIAGIDTALYPGSWSQWSNLDRPVETGVATTSARS